MLLKQDYLQDLADRHGGQVPQPMDLSEEEQNEMIRQAVTDPDSLDDLAKALRHGVSDNLFECLFDSDPEKSGPEFIGELYLLLESDLVDDVDSFNSDARTGEV